MKLEKEILKENDLTNIDKLMDSQFGKPGTPERERFREEARTYVNGHTKTAEIKFDPCSNILHRTMKSSRIYRLPVGQQGSLPDIYFRKTCIQP